MDKLIQGLHHFREHVVVSQRAFFEALAQGQHPSTLFITCSDSRINPNLMTQTGPGELFVLRNVGGMVAPYDPDHPTAETAAIEYAISVLKVQDVVICGHSHCGAMSAVAHKTPLPGLPGLQAWLKHAEPTSKIVETSYKHLSGADLVLATVRENVLVQLDHLGTHPCIKNAVANDGLKLHGWVYEIDTGAVYTYDPSGNRFVALTGGKVKESDQDTGRPPVTTAAVAARRGPAADAPGAVP